MLLPIFLLLTVTTEVFAGTICPPRENIYPCSCSNLPLGKKTFTTSVYCHRLQSTDSLEAIFPYLRSMQIDVFHLYDSFWEAHKLEANGEDKRALPTDWHTLLKIKEIDIVDTTLSKCFACKNKNRCRNTVTQKFSITNSSSHERICEYCDTDRKNMFPWISCMSKLKHFHFSHGKLANISSNFFAFEMKELTILNLTHNEISSIDSKVMNNLPRLKFLDLSHNLIRYLDKMFNSKMNNLEYLDLSWNSIQTLGNGFFAKLPNLKTFNVAYNGIQDMIEAEWVPVPENLKDIDLTDNQLHCDCNIQWINTTFHVNTVLLGRCATPEEYENSLLRKASKLLNERCDGSSIGTRNRKTTKPIKILRKR